MAGSVEENTAQIHILAESYDTTQDYGSSCSTTVELTLWDEEVVGLNPLFLSPSLGLSSIDSVAILMSLSLNTFFEEMLHY